MSDTHLQFGPNGLLLNGDCLEKLRQLPDASVHSVVTDPPYGLSDHKPEEVVACLTAWLAGQPYQPKGKGFMGKAWDAWVPGPEVWRECLRVLKPGGHLLAFAGTRSMDLMCMAVRLAGFELRDSIGWAHDGEGAPLLAWVTGQGFPKSLNVAKAIDSGGGRPEDIRRMQMGEEYAPSGRGRVNYDHGAGSDMNGVADGWEPKSEAAKQWNGWGTALKPAWEPIVLARKPLEGTVAATVLEHGTGALNIDGCRVEGESTRRKNRAEMGYHGGNLATEYSTGSDAGRFPANLIHDGSETVLAAFPDAPGQQGDLKGHSKDRQSPNGTFGKMAPAKDHAARQDSTTSAARFFYCAKATKADRGEGNTHPTVKPTALMRYLCRLVTPPGGLVLDPFMGSGSTGKGAVLEGFRFVGIERDADSFATARARVKAAVAERDQARMEAAA